MPNPAKAEEYFRKGLNSSNYKEKEKHYQAAVKENPLHANALINLAIAQHKNQKDGDATETFQKLVKLDQSDKLKLDNLQKLLVLYHLGLIFEKEGRYDDAISYYRKATAKYEDSHSTKSIWRVTSSIAQGGEEDLYSKALTNCGSCYKRKNDLAAAAGCFEKSITFWPFDPLVWFNYGVVNFDRQKYDIAFYCFLLAAQNGFMQQASGHLSNLEQRGIRPKRPNLDLPSDFPP